LLGLLACLAFDAPVLSQWGSNPQVAAYFDEPCVMVPIGRSVAAIRMVDSLGFEIRTLDDDGVSKLPWFMWAEDDMDTSGEWAGCSLDENTFALTYLKEESNHMVLRIVVLSWDPVLRTVSSVQSYPRTVAEENTGAGFGFGFSHLAMTPNLINGATAVDGALVSWRCQDASGDHQIRQQGVRLSGSRIWDGFDSGVVAFTYAGPGGPSTPTIVSDGYGLAIITANDYEDVNLLSHYSSKVDLDGQVLWSKKLPGQHVEGQICLAPGDCMVTRDGEGGAFYCYANERYQDVPVDLWQTFLIAAQIDVNGVAHLTTFLQCDLDTTLLRPLAVVATPDHTVAIAFRDLVGTRSVCYGSAVGSDPCSELPYQWSAFLSGATHDNSEAADGVMGPLACSDSLAFVWTRYGTLITKALSYSDGHPLWSPNGIVEVPVNTGGGNLPKRPRVFPTRGSWGSGYIYGWYDQGITTGTNADKDGVFADRIKCETGVLGLHASDDFDCYPLGSVLNGQGGWKQWGGAQNSTSIIEDATTGFARSGRSVSIDAIQGGDTSDLLHECNELVSGRHTVRGYTYIPSGNADKTYFLAMNTYSDSGPFGWSIQLAMDPASGLWTIDAGSQATAQGPLIFDQWVEVRAQIDLTADSCQVFYNDTSCAPAYSWTGGIFGAGGGALNIAAIDMYHGPATSTPSGKVYWDDLSISPGISVAAPEVYCTAKVNSLGCTPSIGFTGTASATAGSGFDVTATNVRNNKNGLLFFGVNGRSAQPFQGGTLCVTAPIRRTAVVSSGGTALPANDCSGVYSIDMNAFAVSAGPPIPLAALSVSGTVVDCQYWGRDPGFPAPSNSTLTNALEYTVGP
jgi:hypothetical protein